MKILITGGSGFLGTELSRVFVREGHQVISIDLRPPQIPGIGYKNIDMMDSVPSSEDLKNPDVVINLAGASIGQKWTNDYKKLIYQSRVNSTKNIVSMMRNVEFRPKVLISASGVGVYGDCADTVLDESAATSSDGFLAKVATDWENEASQATNHGVRTVIVRHSHILGKGGILSVFLPFYKWGLGGPIGRGQNFFPWIHVDDVVRIYHKIIQTGNFSGVINAVAPEQTTNKQFSRKLAKALRRPHIFKIPLKILQKKYGEFADEIVKSQRVSSVRIIELGTAVRYQNLQEAFKKIFNNDN